MTEDQLNNGPPHSSNFGYAYAKRMLEVQARAYREQFGTDHICVIPNNLYGENDNYDLENSHVLPALVRKIWEAKLQNKKYFEVWGDGEVYREFTYSEDICNSLLFCMDNYKGSDPINIGNTREHKLKDIIYLICDLLNYNGDIVFDTSKPKGQVRKPTSNKKFIDIGWNDSNYTSLEVGLKKTCDWFIKNYPNIRGINLKK
jgi:GDP-L-fucose synthase